MTATPEIPKSAYLLSAIRNFISDAHRRQSLETRTQDSARRALDNYFPQGYKGANSR